MTIFEPKADEPYERIRAVRDEDSKVFDSFDGGSRARSWRPIPVRRVTGDAHDRGLASDFPWLGREALVMRATAVAALRDILDANGETLPLVSDDGVELFVYNARVCPLALDIAGSRLSFSDNDRVMHVEKPEFIDAALNGVDVFRLPQRGAPTYVSDLFVERAQAAGLRGLRFDEVWSSPNYILGQFFGGYFHQDCFDDGLSPDGIIDEYISSAARDQTYRRRLADLIERYASARDDATLEKDLLRDLGCYYYCQADGLSARAWMQHVARRLRAGS